LTITFNVVVTSLIIGRLVSVIHSMHREALRQAKDEHWVEWLKGLDVETVWGAGRLMMGIPTDGGRTRIPALQRKELGAESSEEMSSNTGKSALLYKEFFPPKMAVSTVPSDPVYPAPAYEWKPISDVLLHRVIARMKPYKATRARSFANCVFKFNADLLVPYLGPIYRALDELEYYPAGWNHIDSVVLRKPSKTNYAVPAAYRPVCLTKDYAGLYNTIKMLQLAMEAERVGILPSSHYGARPGRAATDALHKVVMVVKDAWRRGEVASVLCMDVKGAFPSVDLERLMHDMRMRGVPRQHTEWMAQRYEGRESRIVFDDYTSEPFAVEGGLDQGDPGSGIAYLIYNSDLAEVPRRTRRSGEDSVVYVDHNTMIATGLDYNTTHEKLMDMTGREGEWTNGK
jgi:hypothetical protein